MNAIFSLVHWEWIGVWNKQNAREQLRGSRDLFFPASDSFAKNQKEKDTNSLNMYS